MLPPAPIGPLRRLAALTSTRLPPIPSSSGASPASNSARAVRSPTASRTPRYPATPSRPFSTTIPLHVKTIKPYKLPRDLVPAYPYGERRVYKQSNRGLYGNARVRYGNNVSEKHNTKTQRLWRPNIQTKILPSKALGVRVRLRLTLRVLKTIRREGGLDNYLLKTKPARLQELGPCGWGMRWLVMQTQTVQNRFNDERVKLGLERKEVENKDHIINYVLDHATPGPLNARSRATLASLRAAVADAIILDNGSQIRLDGGKLSGKVDGR
ncbi:hypothetical protein XA68_13637 [Ophiocordyceps unilateralis]|uniref:Large ribosomal subunit protein bL28m n=1 Tax=Ophiocordyceps unilateralis TaxID=268505 RepID=A0A2A9PMX8_OPHUN|nr:hypothetical protein XA68_13637 [Ophiocordyceps unilateralis]